MIFVHELGHFAVAKLSGVRVNEFAIGMGPKLLGITRGETLYSIRLFPLGGFCAMEGEDAESPDERSFYRAPWLSRFAILVAGSLMNMLLGLLIIIILFSGANTLPEPILTDFADEHMQNAAFPLRGGDEILRINGERVYVTGDVVFLLDRYGGGSYTFDVRRDGQRLTIEDVPLVRAEYNLAGETYTGYGIRMNAVPATPLRVVRYAALQSADLVRMIRMSFADMFSGKLSVDDMSGPVGISAAISETAEQSVANMWFLVAFITINLGVMNLLPLPALDGGRLVFMLLELIRRKPVNPKYEGYVHAAGLIAFMLFAVFITYNDIMRIVSR